MNLLAVFLTLATFSSLPLLPAAGPSLTLLGVSGQPGSSLQAIGMAPGGFCALVASPNSGTLTVWSGLCGWVTLDLSSAAQVVAVEIADTNGAATFTRPNGIPAGAAGWIVQVFDFTTCTSTQAITL